MPLFTLTYTGTVGPGISVTSQVIANVQALKFDWDKLILEVTFDGDKVRNLSLTGVTTVTTSVSAKTVTVS